MNTAATEFEITWHERLADIPRDEWDRLARPLATPFLEWDWLDLMERSGSIVPERGWIPQHLAVRHAGRLAAAAPLYRKNDSEGEFVFDHPWAEVAARIGAPYYPKLVGTVPVTPLTGYRFLLDPDHDPARLTNRMLQAIDERVRRLGLGGCSFLFADPDWCPLPRAAGYHAWRHHAFNWQNEGFTDFDDYLARFRSGQRRNIRRERSALAAAGLRVEPVAGEAIPDAFFDHMYHYYRRTNARYGPWGCAYLTAAFFEGLAGRLRRRLVFMAPPAAPADGRPPGMALLVRKGPRLYGRYWGGDPRVRHLHFECCYYRPIEWAIEEGVTRFDPGMGGGHKLRRGFVSLAAFSLHRFVDPRLDALMGLHIGRINRLEQSRIDRLNARMPVKKKMTRDGA